MQRTLSILAISLVAGAAGGATSLSAFDLEGHRGARGLAPENTLAAFRKALAIGVTTLETDVAITRDLVPVISHDPLLNPDLARDASGAWISPPGAPIQSLTAAELRAYDIGRLKPDTAYAKGLPSQQPVDGQRFPGLREVLDLAKANAPVRLNVELKTTPDNAGQTVDPTTFARIVVNAVRAADMTSRVTIQPFDWRGLVAAKGIAPEIETACLTIAAGGMNTMTADAQGRSPWHAGLALADYNGSVPALVKAAGCVVWSPFFHNVTAALVAESHALGLRVLPWTVNDEAEMRRLIDLDVDGLITDYPDRLREAMRAKGLPLP